MAKFLSLILVMICFMLGACQPKMSGPQARKIELKKDGNGKYTLLVDEVPFYIKGAGCEFGDIEDLAASGANSFRTWRTDNGKQTGQEILDRAEAVNLMVTMGLNMKFEDEKFSYTDEAAVKEQFAYLRGEVMKYKNHPALLVWDIGNGLNLDGKNPQMWKAVNDLAAMVHELDPNHPVTTTIAGINKDEINEIQTICPEIDFLSFQMYADVNNLQKRLDDAQYYGPYIISEWGPTGHWEVRTTAWNAPIEPTSEEKATLLLQRYRSSIEPEADHCLGSYVFIWEQKQERTPTWYGFFTEQGDRIKPAEIMEMLWTNKWPKNRCPVLKSFSVEGAVLDADVVLKPAQAFWATVDCSDPESDSLTFYWELLPETPDLKNKGQYEPRPYTLLSLTGNSSMKIIAPESEGAYRIFVYVSDGKGNAATANIPFLVSK